MSSTEPSSEILPPGTTLGRYEIRRLIGQGGMGCVYEAIHRDLKKRVAIKTLLPALAANEEAKQRFFREGEAASRIRHPHVVDVTDVGAEGATIYLVMEFLQGEDLSALVARSHGLAVDRAVDLLLPVMAAITVAHEQGVVHRDLKPENIFLAASEYGSGVVPKVLDFGISKVLDEAQRMALTGTAVTLGTAYYLPPEQLRGSRQADARGDQYALGAILYECLTGQRAFDGETLYAVLKAVSDGAYPPLPQRRPDVPPALVAIIARAMSLEPTARFESVRGLGLALLPFASPSPRTMWQPFFAAGAPPATGPVAVATPAPVVRTPASPASSLSPVAAPSSPRLTTPSGATGAPSFRSPASSEDLRSTLSVSRSRLPLLAGLVAIAVVAVVVAAMRHEAPAPPLPAPPTALAKVVALSPAPAPATPPAATEPASARPDAPPPAEATATAPTVTPPPTEAPRTSRAVAAPVPGATANAAVAPASTGTLAPSPSATRPRRSRGPTSAGGGESKTVPSPSGRVTILPNSAPIVE